ncbi:MAG: tRNA epoxyqueuosine(34) reductase QueG [Clostridium sp.]|uniref:tRNA epoxyqueuosine(34) reductase QueG n=1 Tax=Clostridium sp. TaxID=1506 RepID=UPI003055E7D1
MDAKEKIIKFTKELGIDIIGFTECRRFEELEDFFRYREENKLFNEFEEQDIEKKLNPKLLMTDGETIISIAFPYYHGEGDSEHGFSLYTKGTDYHKVLKGYLKKICEFIETIGGRAESFVDSNPLPERYIAAKSGIGFIGKNNTLITEKYGSYVFLGEIITNLKLKVDEPKGYGCMGCNLCVKKCPTNVIIDDVKSFNSSCCVSYLTQKKHLELIELPMIEGNIFGCDACQKICPHNKGIDISWIQEFIPMKYMKEVDLLSLIKLDNKGFKEIYSNHSCGWRGKNLLIRNGLINYYFMYNDDKDEIQKVIKSPYIKEYYDMLFK